MGTRPSPRVNVSAAVIHDGKILLVEFHDENGPHFNFPGGGLEVGESLQEAARRECYEETGALVKVGKLLVLWEYVPETLKFKYGKKHKLGFLYQCTLVSGDTETPLIVRKPDPGQIGVKWIPLTELVNASEIKPPLVPRISDQLLKALAQPEENAPVVISDI